MLGCVIYYFSTHGWLFVVSLAGGAFDDEEAALAAFAAALALLSKKFAMWLSLSAGSKG